MKTKIAVGILVAMGVIIALYGGISIYFINHFYYGTMINGCSVSCMTMNKAKELIGNNINNYSLKLIERDGLEEFISGQEIELTVNIDNTLELVRGEQSPFLWFTCFFEDTVYNRDYDVSYNEDELNKRINKLQCLDEKNIIQPVNASILFETYSYSIIPHKEGTKLNEDLLKKNIKECIIKLNNELNLESTNTYIEAFYKEDSEAVVNALNTANKYIKAKISYELGGTFVTVDYKIIKSFINISDDFQVEINPVKINLYVASLAEDYDTVGITREFTSSYNTKAIVTGGDYGYLINKDLEAAELINNIKSGKEISREPVYEQMGNGRNLLNDFGDSYVEVNLTTQHLFCYYEGELVLESDVVTGKPSTGHGTPQGVYIIKYKMKNAILRGDDYATPVGFWIPFNRGIGLHDATWQSSFGGERYITNGSHGCVNLPYNVAATIYDYVDVGTAVICYY